MAGATFTGSVLASHCPARSPPKRIPATKNRFQISFFQSYLKKGIPAGTQDAQMCLRDELIPNDLFPNSRSVGTVRPIRGPAMYQGQGGLINSIILDRKRKRLNSRH